MSQVRHGECEMRSKDERVATWNQPSSLAIPKDAVGDEGSKRQRHRQNVEWLEIHGAGEHRRDTRESDICQYRRDEEHFDRGGLNRARNQQLIVE